MNIGITGARGFIGSALISTLQKSYQFNPIHSDLFSNETAIKESLKDNSAFIHLAAISTVGECEKNLGDAFKINVGQACAMAELFFRQNPHGHFIFTSTGQVYDELEPLPHTELTKIKPKNIYAETKVCAELALSKIAALHNGRLTILRMYNHTHMTQNTKLVLPSILKQLNESTSTEVKLKVGNIDVDRDFSALQDLVNAFALLIADQSSQKSVEVFNLCSGKAKNLAQLIISLANRLGKKVFFEVDPALVRPNEPKVIVGDSSKFQNLFHWQSRSNSIEDFLDLFLSKI